MPESSSGAPTQARITSSSLSGKSTPGVETDEVDMAGAPSASAAAARRAARFGDGFFPGRIDRLDELLEALRDECRELGRNADEKELTTGTPDMSLDNIKAMADKGISRLVMPPPGTSADDIRRGLEQFAEAVIRHI